MKLVKIILPCLLLTACFGSSKQAKFYTQTADSAKAICADFTSLVGVNRIQLPKYVDRPQMITQQKDSTQVTISEYNRWVEFPSVLATRVVTEDLSSLLPAARVKMNQLKGDKFDWTISVDIVKINAVLGNQAELVAWYTLKDKSGNVLIHQKFAQTVLIGNSYDDVAKGYSQLLAALSQEIADSLIKQ